MGEGDYTIENVYQGGYSTFDSPKNYIKTGSFGTTTDPRTANILKDASAKLSAGVKQIELTLITPQVMDSIPKQQLEEVRRLGKLTGVNFSVHGPVIDTIGMTQQGYSELNRENSERILFETIERSHELDPKGNVNVTFHSAEGIAGSEWKNLQTREAKKLIGIDRETGQMIPLEEERLHYPASPDIEKIERKIQSGGLSEEEFRKNKEKYLEYVPVEKGKVLSPEYRLQNANATKWDNEIKPLMFSKETADQILEKNLPVIAPFLNDLYAKKINPNDLSPTQQNALSHIQNARAYLDDLKQKTDALFHKAYKLGDEHQQNVLKEVAENYRKQVQGNNDLRVHSKAIQNLLQNLNELTPETYIPLEQFAVEQSSKTYGNVAFKAWKKYKDSAPIVSIENPPAGFLLSTGEDLKNLIEASREHFVKKATAEGISESEARKQAEKLIGATWDVGHINMLRGKGFSDKDIIRETEKIAPLLKHVHLSDNFGFEHTELPMGMGNVPLKEIMEKLGEKGFEAKKIIEAGQWWQHFQTSPVLPTFENMGGAIYTENVTPYWNQSAGFQQNYFGGYGMMLPQVNYERFGAGFSQLPTELGGQRQSSGGSRMSGRGME